VKVESEIVVVYVEDDERLARLTGQYLTGHGVVVHLVTRGDQAVGEVLKVRPDVVLLDLMLPGTDGLEVCRQIRHRLDVPIIMVTARTEEADRVLGLEGGADDYVAKPFQSRELLARIRAQARRGRGEAGPRAERITLGPLVVDAQTMQVTLDNKPVHLTTIEFSLLYALAQRAGRVMARDQLLQMLHGSSEEAFDRSIDVVVSRLRSKIEPDAKNPRLLKTIRGVGYMLAPSEGFPSEV
jgi:DNA-binding response OmpR family regulator